MLVSPLSSKKIVLPFLCATSMALGLLLGRNGPLSRQENRVHSGPDNPNNSTSSKSQGSRERGNSSPAHPFSSANPERSRAQFDALMDDFGNSPFSSLDFTTMFQIWEMAADLDAPEIETLLNSLESQAGGSEAIMASSILAQQFGAQAGSRALSYFLAQKNSPERNAGFASAMVGWMKKDPDTAYRWLNENKQQLSHSTKSDDFVAMYFSLKSKDNYSGALEEAFQLEGLTRKTVIQTLTEQVATDPSQRAFLLDTLRSQGDLDQLRRTEHELIDHLSWQDPTLALDVLKEFEVSPERQHELEHEVIKTWIGNDPEGALEWQRKKYEGSDNAGEQIADTFRNWVGKDEAAASEWLRAQGDEFQSDLVFQKAGEILQHRQPARAAEWHAQVFDDAARQEGYRKLYNRWKRQDPDAAQHWKLSLPESDRIALPEQPDKFN